jgi:RecJ-like exonuclease
MTKMFYYSSSYIGNGQVEYIQKCEDIKYQCPRCEGYGAVQVGSPDGDFIESCDVCHGTGLKYIRVTLKEYDELKANQKPKPITLLASDGSPCRNDGACLSCGYCL